MLKLIIGVKGTGKTKTLIESANAAATASRGNVVFVEKGTQLRFNVKSTVRLIDTDEYGIQDAEALYGFIAGILASNYDVTDMFVDNTMKICKGDPAALDNLLIQLNALLAKHSVNLLMSASLPVESASETVLKYL